MKAIRQSTYGSPDVLALEDVDLPPVPDDAVLVRVRASSVNAVDWHQLRGEPFLVRLGNGLRAPRDAAIGVDCAGVVEAVGADVTDLQPGDEVFGARTGAFAEYVAGRNFVRMPAGLTFEEAAALPVAATTALQALRDKGRLVTGERVLITGAAGGVGHLAVQIACSLGAHVTAVCRPAGVEAVRRLGADEVIDSTTADYLRAGERYDLIIDIAGRRRLLDHRRILGRGGRLVVVGGPGGRWIHPADRSLQAMIVSRLGLGSFRPFLATIKKDDLSVLKDLAEAGSLRPVIDRTCALSDTPDAIRDMERGDTIGKIVIAV